MNSDHEFLGYGQYLKQIRVEKNISLDRVSKITKISIQMLELIETEDEDQLPENLFVRNFIRLYAGALGIDGQDALNRYSPKTGGAKTHFQIYKPLPIIDKKLGAYLGAAAVLLLALISWFIMSASKEDDNGPGRVPEMKMQGLKTSAASDEKKGSSPDPYNIYHDQNQQNTKYILHAKAIEKTWLKVVIDGQSPMEYMLEPREEIALEALKGFDLLIGNAGGIRLELNGKYVNVPGRSGQVASLKIP